MAVVPIEVVKRFEKTESSFEGRFQVWKDSWHVFLDNPLTGIGPGTYQEYLMRKTPQLRRAKEKGAFVPRQPENGYLKILYETGLLGIVGIFYFLWGFGKQLYKNLQQKNEIEVVSRSLAMGLGLLVFLATFITLFTISDARNAIIPVLLFSLLFADNLNTDQPTRHIRNKHAI